MVESLLHIYGYASKNTLEGLSEDRIEWLEGIGEARSHEGIAHSHKFHLLDMIHCVYSLVDKPRKEPHHVGQYLQHGGSIEDLNRKRHVHNRLACHHIRAHLLQDHLKNALLSLYCLLIAEDQISIVEFPSASL